MGAKTLGLTSFNFDNKYGRAALLELFKMICRGAGPPSMATVCKLHAEEIVEIFKESPKFVQVILNNSNFGDVSNSITPDKVNFFIAAAIWLAKVGVDVFDQKDVNVGRFLNRLLGLETSKQNAIFAVCQHCRILSSPKMLISSL